MLRRFKDRLLAYLNVRSIRRHRSRIGWQVAGRYTRYYDRCRRQASVIVCPNVIVAAAANQARREGVSSFWTEQTGAVAERIRRRIEAFEASGRSVWAPPDAAVPNSRLYTGDVWYDHPELAELFAGDLGDFLHGFYGTSFKILFGSMYRTQHADRRHGSQLWHSDSGPGICINLMYYLHDTTPAHGTLEALSWRSSQQIFEAEIAARLSGELQHISGYSTRHCRAQFAERMIVSKHAADVRQPFGKAGLVVPFLNNTLHRGGYPAPGLTRTAMVWQCYPSHLPTNLERYNATGVKKRVAYPLNPAQVF